jgi:hypothetical protein
MLYSALTATATETPELGLFFLSERRACCAAYSQREEGAPVLTHPSQRSLLRNSHFVPLTGVIYLLFN